MSNQIADDQVTFRCDGCGSLGAGYWSGRQWTKPLNWWQRSDQDGCQIACSRECIDKVANKSGKTSVVLPV